MEREQLHVALREALPVHRVSDLKEFPFKTHTDFVQAMQNGDVQVLTAFDSGALVALGGPGSKGLHYALTWTPMLVAAACVIAAVLTRAFSPLLGVPLAFVGMFLSIPGFMRSIGNGLNRLLLILLIYLFYQGATIPALLVFSYVASNFACHFARHHCRNVLVRAAAESELVMVWLVSKGSLFLT